MAMPEEPTADASVGSPRRGPFFHILHGRDLCQLIELFDSQPNTEIAHRENVRLPGGEHEKHLNGPGANAMKGKQFLGNFRFGEVADSGQVAGIFEETIH